MSEKISLDSSEWDDKIRIPIQHSNFLQEDFDL